MISWGHLDMGGCMHARMPHFSPWIGRRPVLYTPDQAPICQNLGTRPEHMQL